MAIVGVRVVEWRGKAGRWVVGWVGWGFGGVIVGSGGHCVGRCRRLWEIGVKGWVGFVRFVHVEGKRGFGVVSS